MQPPVVAPAAKGVTRDGGGRWALCGSPRHPLDYYVLTERRVALLEINMAVSIDCVWRSAARSRHWAERMLPLGNMGSPARHDRPARQPPSGSHKRV